MDMQAMSLLAPMWILMVKVLESAGLQGQTVSGVYTGTEPVDCSKIYLEKELKKKTSFIYF